MRLPREDGALWMALMCWVCGWAAALKLAWEPLVVAIAVVCLLLAAQTMRRIRRALAHDPPAAGKMIPLLIAALLPPAGVLLLFLSRMPDEPWLLAIPILALLYAPIIITGEERLPTARVLAVVAITAIAPATYSMASGCFSRGAAILWASLGGYFLLSSVFVMARFHRSRTALWFVRVAATVAFGLALLCSSQRAGHWLLSGAFLILALRTWVFRPEPGPLDPRRVGQAELAFGATAAALVTVGIWLS